MRKFGTLTRPFPPGAPPEFPVDFWRFPLHSYGESLLVYRPDSPPEVLSVIKDLLFKSVRIKHDDVRKPGSDSMRRRSDLVKWIHLTDKCAHLRPLNPDERDRSLGYPAGYSRPSAPPSGGPPLEWGRAALVGNAWAPPVTSHVLGPLGRAILAGVSPDSKVDIRPFESEADTISALKAGLAAGPRQGGPPPGAPPPS